MRKQKRQLMNIHASLKWSWQLIMGWAFMVGVESLYETITVSNKSTISLILQPQLLLFFSLFVLTFIRFMYGNNRYLDVRYIEFLYDIEEKKLPEVEHLISERAAKLSGLRRFYDIVMLLVTGIIFTMLAHSLRFERTDFISYYRTLIWFNIFFLLVSVVWNIRLEIKKSYHNRTAFEQLLKREQYPGIWILNNFACIILFDFLNSNTDLDVSWLFIVIFFINSLVDFYFAWFFYFPETDESKLLPK